MLSALMIMVLAPSVSSAASAPVPQTLRSGQSVASDSGRFLLVMQGDGNLVVYDRGVGPIWATYSRTPGSYLAVQSDGNVVVYDLSGRAVWATMTYSPTPTQLVMQDDGNLVLYAGTRPLWDSHGFTGVRGRTLQAGQTVVQGLAPGAVATSSSGQWSLVMTTEGALALQTDGNFRHWSSFTTEPNASLVVQADGNAVVVGAAGPLWSTSTADYPGAVLYLQDDGNLVMYSLDGVARWDRFGYTRVVLTDVVTGLNQPWDLGFLADGSMVFTQRRGVLQIRSAGGQLGAPITAAGAKMVGDGGLLGLAVDPAGGGRIYVCQTTQTPGGRYINEIFGWTVSGLSATRDATPILQFPFHTNHNGCQLQFGADGYLYVGTGDSESAPGPQATDSLYGKVLRIQRDGTAAPGNPNGFRWVSKGHRNVQGLAVQPVTGLVYSVEHGTNRDDEVNLIRDFGQNAGWDPRRLDNPSVYDQDFPMTNYERFPDAARPVWESGSPTIATSGATFISGPQWRDWDGSLIVCALAATQIRRFVVDGENLVSQEIIYGGRFFGFPRFRAAVQGPDGALYITTDMRNGIDRIIRVTRPAG
jgi:glucose/arabinose dehydrogenase